MWSGTARPVVGYGFNSNGRYAQGALLRERFIPRIMGGRSQAADLSRKETTWTPSAIWDVMMANEKPGGHGERSVAVGVVDMAVWDAVAKIEGKPLCRLLADRYRGGKADEKVFVYAAGGYYYPGKELDALKVEMQGYLDMGYRVVKMKIGGAGLEEDLRRIECVLGLVGRGGEAGRGRERTFRSSDRRRLREGHGAVRAPLVRGAGRPARLRRPCRTGPGL